MVGKRRKKPGIIITTPNKVIIGNLAKIPIYLHEEYHPKMGNDPCKLHILDLPPTTSMVNIMRLGDQIPSFATIEFLGAHWNMIVGNPYEFPNKPGM